VKESTAKVLLINPQRNLRNPSKQFLSIPTSLASLASFLQVNGYLVEILDTIIEDYNNWQLQPNGIYKCGLSDEEVKKRVEEFSPDFVGISNQFTPRSSNVNRIAQVIKSVSKEITVIVGGMHATTCAEPVLDEPAIDFIVMGEAEIPFLSLLMKLRKNETDYETIPGISFTRNGEKIISKDRVILDDINILPMPAYELIDFEKYFKFCAGRDGMTTERRYASIITSRGCPFQCSFCSSVNLWGNRWRARAPQLVVYEIEWLLKQYDIREISIEDDNFSVAPDRLELILRELIHRNLQFKWNTPNGVSVVNLTPDLLRLMKQSGCTRLNFGVESGDPYILHDIINKKIPFDKIKHVIRSAHKEGIITTGYFVLGMPGETIESLERTLKFAKSLDLDEIGLNIAVPYPQTVLEQSVKKNGYLKKDASLMIAEDDIGKVVFFETPMLSEGELLGFKNHFFKDFYKDKILKNPLYYGARALKDPSMIGRFLWKKSQ